MKISIEDFEDVGYLQKASGSLWQILDDISTASDMFKPNDEAGYKKFYEFAMKNVEKRHKWFTSDGYDLFIEENQRK